MAKELTKEQRMSVVEACNKPTERGGVHEILKKEGVTRSQLDYWRKLYNLQPRKTVPRKMITKKEPGNTFTVETTLKLHIATDIKAGNEVEALSSFDKNVRNQFKDVSYSSVKVSRKEEALNSNMSLNEVLSTLKK